MFAYASHCFNYKIKEILQNHKIILQKMSAQLEKLQTQIMTVRLKHFIIQHGIHGIDAQ